jgi:alcohol dehydrogenase class IV
VRRLCENIGIPPGLSLFGVREDDLLLIAREARGSSLEGNPVEPEEGALIALLREAL